MSATAQLLNSAESCVDDMLQGFCAAHPGLSLDPDKRVIRIRGDTSGNVAIVSGGGSGHEPFAAGYVGRGMLSAAVAGAVFASPPSGHIQSAIRSVATPAGVLVIIPNYTGDCLNFGLAIEKTRSSGLLVEGVLVGEDCALDGRESATGRRGMCGLLFVFKICGHLAERGLHLGEVAETARRVVAAMATIGVGLKACRLPGQQETLFHVPEGHMELGLGVHGEAGLSAVKVCSAAETVQLMLERLQTRLCLSPDDRVAVLVNNLGSLSQLEQWVVASEVDTRLSALGVGVLRMYVGHLMTSLDTVGFQVSVLKLPASELQSDWLRCLDAGTDAPAWPGSQYSSSHLPREESYVARGKSAGPQEHSTNIRQPAVVDTTQRCLLAAARALVENEDRLNQLDSGCGDGDCGSTLRRLAEAVESNISEYAGLSTRELLQMLADASECAMGGTSGAIYSLLFTTAAASGEEGGDWAAIWRAGLEGVMKYSRARLGDRTMLDAMIPACEAFAPSARTAADAVTSLGRAVSAAQSGCEATRLMNARAGRASYVRASHATDVDAGAFAVCLWLDAIRRELLRVVV